MSALLFLLVAAPAMAQPGPPILPTRDVSVAYHVEGPAVDAIPGGLGGILRLSWDAARTRLRVDSDGRPQALLVDLNAPSAVVMDRGLHTALTLKVRDKDVAPLLQSTLGPPRRGSSVVAGLSCRTYPVQSPRSQGTVCLTDDGVILQADGQIDGRHGHVTALSVQYAPQPPGVFQVPPGYLQFGIPDGFAIPGGQPR